MALEYIQGAEALQGIRPEDPGHLAHHNDIHLPLSYADAQWLLTHYPDADSEVVLLSALLHDIGWAVLDQEKIISEGMGPNMMEAETDPQLYKAVIAVAPVTDLGMLKDDAKGYTSAKVVADFVGDGPHIEEGSPLRHVERIQAPVLLVHGDLDANVAFRHSQKMADALQAAGKDVEFLQYKGLDHQLRDSTVRAELLSHMAQLLDRTIGH